MRQLCDNPANKRPRAEDMPSSSTAEPAQPKQPRAAGKFAVDAEPIIDKQLAAALTSHRKQFNLRFKANNALEALLKHKEGGTFPPTLAISIPKVTANWKNAHLSKHEETLKVMKLELLEEAIRQRISAKATAQAALDAAPATFVVVPLSSEERVVYDAAIRSASALLSARLL